ncbi:MAG: ATP-binding protein [Prevotellaceae bacterium]|jgi:signal transduction histidine kinase|nr:ATP-binding protein [Prevotellaceae bacterium]
MQLTRYHRIFLLLIALLIIGFSLIFTDRLAQRLAIEERHKIEFWAEAVRRFNDLSNTDPDFDFMWKIIENNTNIPVIIADEQGNYISSVNFPRVKGDQNTYFAGQIKRLKSVNAPIEIFYSPTEKQYIYYDDSILLKLFAYFPYIQLSIIIVFLAISFWAFASDKKAEQNRVWVGLSKETAHQLGTPISSLLAWEAILKERHVNDEVIAEMGKDVARLNTIARRFSKVGSPPVCMPENVFQTLDNAVNYMKKRTSSKVSYAITAPDRSLTAKLDISLFEWVIENLCKNAVDAMEGNGAIAIHLTEGDDRRTVIIDITDSGKGIERSNFRTIFTPGFTTKARGWGLGLSLAKRIIEEYHQGKIFIKTSEIGKGTTFRILLPQ